MRIGSNTIQNNLLRQLQDTNAGLNETSYQISTGKRAQQMSDMASDVSRLLNFEDVKASNDTYINNLTNAEARLEATENTLNSMEDLMVKTAQLSTLARTENSAETRATLAPQAQSLLKNFYNLLNTKFDGRYIFSGQNASTAPITGDPAAAAYAGDPPSSTYYQGDATKVSVVTGPGATTTYGVTGDDEAFARIKQGLEALWYGLSNDSDIDIDGAVSMLEQAQKDLVDIKGTVGGEIANFDLLSQRYTETQGFIQQQIDDIDTVDITEAMTNLTQYQASMEASMLVITRLNALSLLDFIR